MKAAFGILSLLIVLGVVAVTAKRQMQALGTPPALGLPPAVPAEPQASTVAGSAAAVENQVREQAARALQQGADRAASADQ